MNLIKYILIVFILTLQFSSVGQLVFETSILDFGELNNDSPKFMDVKITNTGIKKAYILNYKAPREVACLFSAQAAEKDSMLIFRVQPSPKKLGKFHYEIPIYTSDKLEPTLLVVQGKLTEEIYDPLAAMQACPDFRSTPSKHATDFKLTIKTIDKKTKENLENTLVYLIQQGVEIGQHTQNKTGKIQVKTPLGFIYFFAKHKGYLSAEMCKYVNITDNTVVLELEKDTSVSTKQIEILEKPAERKENPSEETKPDLETLLTLEKPSEQTTPILPSLESLPTSDFDIQHFQPVNVLFVVDISTSMGIGNRMELMKFSLLELTNMLRVQDKIGIVSYANNAQILLNPTSGNQKTEIQDAIKKLKSGGMTAGGEGIKLGCKTISTSLIEGKNIIYIITDGAFNKDSKNYMESIDKYKKMGIQVCVIGIQNTPHDAINMQKIATLGGGTYTSIQKLADAKTALIQEIRNQSFRNK
jgi:Ca-activated chloride channel family protein